MKKLEKTELPEVLPVTKGKNTLLRAMLIQLKVDEGLFLPNSEWKSKKSPYYILAAIKRKYHMEFEYGFKTDGTGWLFRRVK